MLRHPLVALATSLLAPCLAAAPQADSDAPDVRKVLQKTCQKMAYLQGLEFSTIEQQDGSMMRQIGRGLGGGDIEVVGTWTPDTQMLEIGDDDEVVIHRGRQIARDDDRDWAIRRARLAAGGELPFVFDPALFFDVLGRVPVGDLEFARDQVEISGDHEFRVITLTIDDDVARELTRAGAIPEVSGGGRSIIRIAGGLGGQLPEPDLLTDIALFVDPVSNLVHRIRVKSYQESQFGGNVIVQVQGAGIGINQAEQEEEVEAADDDGTPRFKDGLPVRKVDSDQSAMTFSVRISKHDMPIVPDLDDGARRMLRMR